MWMLVARSGAPLRSRSGALQRPDCPRLSCSASKAPDASGSPASLLGKGADHQAETGLGAFRELSQRPPPIPSHLLLLRVSLSTLAAGMSACPLPCPTAAAAAARAWQCGHSILVGQEPSVSPVCGE